MQTPTARAAARPRVLLAALIIGWTCTAGVEVRAGSPSYEIGWYTIDSGGGRSADSRYELIGTLGQSDADLIAICSEDGGPDCILPKFEISGGFWPIPPLVEEAPPCDTGPPCIFRSGFEAQNRGQSTVNYP